MLMVYILAAWFFVCIFSRKSYALVAFIIFSQSLFNVIVVKQGFLDGLSYLDANLFLIKLDGVTAMILSMFILFQKGAIKQAVLLCFAVLFHSMLHLHSVTDSGTVWILSKWFYESYEELIITVGLLQILASYGEFTRSLGNIQSLLLRFVFYFNSSLQNFYMRKDKKGKEIER